MKKGKIIGAVVLICGAVVLGVFLGKGGFFGTAVRETAGMDAGQEISFSSDVNVDVITRHALPSLERMEEGEQRELVDSLQVMKKMELLGLEQSAFLYPELNLEKVERAVEAMDADVWERMGEMDFEGMTSGELQQMIDANEDCIINICSEQIAVLDTIRLKSNLVIRGNGVEFACSGIEHVFDAEDVSNVCMDNIMIDGNADYGVFIAGGRNIILANSTIRNANQKAVCIVGDTAGFKLCDNRFNQNGAGGLYIAGDVSNGLIEGNEIRDNRGTSNWMAGIVLTSDNPQNRRDIWDNFDEAHRWPYRENLYGQTKAPHDIIVRNNVVSGGNSSGIYSDGAYGCHVIGNKVTYHDKEGMCLDYATIGFYLKENTFEGNGRRIRQTDEDLEMDFVLGAGRMEDGSARAKLPGISMDNTAYNILENNIVINNYGGGIKMVRTTVRSLITGNMIRDNNIGQNDSFHFFGIEVGSADADAESEDLDFAPGFENIICRNIITGNHYAGVFIGEGCYINDVFDNIIMDPQMYAVESVSAKFNSIVNNPSNFGIRNEWME